MLRCLGSYLKGSWGARVLRCLGAGAQVLGCLGSYLKGSYGAQVLGCLGAGAQVLGCLGAQVRVHRCLGAWVLRQVHLFDSATEPVNDPSTWNQ